MLTGNALLAALEILPQQRLRGEFWRVVTASSLLGLEIEAGRTTVTRRFPDWLYAGGPTLNGGRYTPIGGPMTRSILCTLYLTGCDIGVHAV